MDMAGGSEFRAVELSNAIAHIDGYASILLVEKRIPEKLRLLLGARVDLRERVFTGPEIETFYTLDHLLIINSDSRRFATEDYWRGRTTQGYSVDLSRLKAMTFLFNFIVSPACQLPGLQRWVRDLRIVTTNAKFFE